MNPERSQPVDGPQIPADGDAATTIAPLRETGWIPDRSAPTPAVVAALPAHIGRYRILRLLGEGGMGAVYEAEQDRPQRGVALKVIKPGFASPELLRRFEHESRALGRLQHPGIAQIYEAGAADAGFGLQPASGGRDVKLSRQRRPESVAGGLRRGVPVFPVP